MKHLKVALSQIRQREIRGREDNPEILKYFDALGFDGKRLKDETSWCAAYANWVLKESGLEYQNTLNARSFLKIGTPTNDPDIGDIVVFWRESINSWKGHVGFYMREDDKYIYVLGGNQGNEVNVSAYYKSRLLGYRKIKSTE